MTARKSNTKSKDFYVYLHRKATTGEVFYVGKGHGMRAFDKNNGRNRYWMFIVAKHGYTIDFYATGLQEWYAFELEKELIAYYGRENLCNLTDGGEGASGIVFTEESKIKMSNARIGKKRSQETRIKMSESAKNAYDDDLRRKRSEFFKGRKKSKSQVEKMRIVASKPVICSNGMFFDSATKAAEWLVSIGFLKAHHSNISKCANGDVKSAYGYKWSRPKNTS